MNWTMHLYARAPGNSMQCCSDVMLEVKSLHSTIQSMLKLTRMAKLPIGLSILLQDTFICKICLSSPIEPPLMISKCCKLILGCQRCIDKLFEGDAGRRKACPLCKQERAFTETSQLHGIDNLLNGIKPLISQEDTAEA